MKRKCQSSSNTTSSNSDDGKQKGTSRMQVSEGMFDYLRPCLRRLPATCCHLSLTKLRPLKKAFALFKHLSQTLQCQLLVRISCSLLSLAEPALLKDQSGLTPLDAQDKKSSDAATAVVGTSLPLPVPNKPESVVSITSQCSYSSTIVHVGDKKPQPESGTVPRKSKQPLSSLGAYLLYKDVRPDE